MAAPLKCRGNRSNGITLGLLNPLGLMLFVTLGAAPLIKSPVLAKGQFSSSTTGVEVYASVTDASGKPVRGLSQSDFEVTEDGVPQRVSAFVAGDFPLRVAVALDSSFSMAGEQLRAAKTAARTFLSALRPADESIVLAIGSEVTTIAGASDSRAAQSRAVDALDAWGRTKLNDAIIESIGATDGARGRRAVVILSDGDERDSSASAADVVDRARRSNVMIYPVAIGRARPPLFAELSTATGGRSFFARDLRTLDSTMRTIAEELGQQYLLGYSPTRALVAGSDEWRSITVRVKRPGLSLRARDGYYVK
ncbi:MAG: VWA domain-containing protein [Acidobacteria bacterium]|nr:VWA domain-containing protein [Acidobacteriota bacterium]